MTVGILKLILFIQESNALSSVVNFIERFNSINLIDYEMELI